MTDETRQPLEQASRALWPQLPFFFPHSKSQTPVAPFVPYSPFLSLPDRSDSLHSSISRPRYLSRRSVSPSRVCHASPMPAAPGHKNAARAPSEFLSATPDVPQKEAPSSQSRSAGRSTPRAANASSPFQSARFPPDKPFTQADYNSLSSFQFILESKEHGVETLDFSWDGDRVETLKFELSTSPSAPPDSPHVEVFNFEKTAPPIPSTTSLPPPAESFAYKKVENRVKPVSTTLPEHFRIERRTPSDPLAEIPILPHHPPEFSPGARYTAERKEAMNVNPDGFLLPDEEKLVHHIIREHEPGFAWRNLRRGSSHPHTSTTLLSPQLSTCRGLYGIFPSRLASMIASWKLSSRK